MATEDDARNRFVSAAVSFAVATGLEKGTSARLITKNNVKLRLGIKIKRNDFL